MKKILIIVVIVSCVGFVLLSGGAAQSGAGLFSKTVSREHLAASLGADGEASKTRPAEPNEREIAPALPTATSEMTRYMEALSAESDRTRFEVERARMGFSTRWANYGDNSRENIESLKVAATAGNDESLVALMAMTSAEPDYVEQMLPMLLINATRGSPLALNTLSVWAATGRGFSAPDPEASIMFEQLAWLTGNDDQYFEFYPTHVGSTWTASQCQRAVTTARAMASGRPWFDRASGENGVHPSCLAGA